QLYTPYIDLRAVSLDEARPYVRTASDAAGAPAELPDLPDAADLEIVEDNVRAKGALLAADLLERGVRIETFGAWLARDPAAFRAAIEGGRTLPADDKLAHLARGFWSQGIHVEVADGVTLDRPILLRWRSSNPGRALITRTLVT